MRNKRVRRPRSPTGISRSSRIYRAGKSTYALSGGSVSLSYYYSTETNAGVPCRNCANSTTKFSTRVAARYVLHYIFHTLRKTTRIYISC